MANIQPNSNVPHPERNFGVSSRRRADDFQAMPWATQHVSFSKVGLTGVALNRLLELVNKFSTTFSHQERDRMVLQKALETVLDRRKSVRDLALMLFGGDDEMSYQVHFAFEQALKWAGAQGTRWRTVREDCCGTPLRADEKVVLAIPQNHDWFDSVTTFCRYFVGREGKPDFVGANARQTRTYFAARLPHGWWILGLDFALRGDIDRNQFEAFCSLWDTAREGPRILPGDNVILVFPTPYWTEPLDTGAPRIAPLWMDFNPSATGSGHVYANGTTPGSFTVTWNGVYTFNTTIPGTMQIKLDASNNVTVTYGTLGPSSTAQVGTTIIGASPGGTTTANTVSLATRPAIVSVNNFADVLVTPTGTPAPYSGTKMTWTPTNPGYVIADVTCTPNTLPPAAKSEVVGIGCPPASASNIPTVYETYTSATLDISGMNFTFLPNGGNGFLVVPGIAGPMFTGFTNNG